jgi:hypothetical protein
MRNITVSVDDETYRRVPLWAIMHDTTVSALVRQFFASLRHRPTPQLPLLGEEITKKTPPYPLFLVRL